MKFSNIGVIMCLGLIFTGGVSLANECEDLGYVRTSGGGNRSTIGFTKKVSVAEQCGWVTLKVEKIIDGSSKEFGEIRLTEDFSTFNPAPEAWYPVASHKISVGKLLPLKVYLVIENNKIVYSSYTRIMGTRSLANFVIGDFIEKLDLKTGKYIPTGRDASGVPCFESYALSGSGPPVEDGEIIAGPDERTGLNNCLFYFKTPKEPWNLSLYKKHSKYILDAVFYPYLYGKSEEMEAVRNAYWCPTN